jgi:cell division protein FtsW
MDQVAPVAAPPRAAASWTGQARDRMAARFSFLDRPLTDFYLVLGITTLLLALGLVMVLSTSSAAGLMAGGSPWSGLQHQLLGVLIGLPCMWLAARSAPGRYRAAAYPLMFIALLGLVVVLFVPTQPGSAGVARWLQIGGFQFQPSELAKFAFLLWGADLLARKEKLRQLTDARQLLIPLMPGAGILALLVEMGHDIGSTCVLMAIFLGLLWVVGCPRRVFFGVLGLMLFGLIIVILTSAYARSRLQGFLSPATATTVNDAKWQYLQGRNALGSGGLFGVVLGASRGTWGWVSESSTDFIFAILGEELGLVGTLSVVLLYGGIAYAGIRVARRMTDTFMRLAAAAVTIWIVFQALINIGAVLGLLPITGIPLPLVSEGLSSLLVTMAGLGMLLSFARREPGAEQALAAAGPSVPRRILSWLGLGVRRP